MGNTMSCFDRWGKRAPDGPLFAVKKSGGESGKSPSAFNVGLGSASTTASAGSSSASAAKSKAAAPAERSTRRRQTYSSNAPKSADTEVSSYDEADDFDESEEEEELTTSDVRQKKLLTYRRNLTKIVKLKTHLFSATVKVTCSRDGKDIEWYKGHSAEGGRNKPVGSMPVDKITSVKSQADNPKGLTISVNNPSPTTFSFTFKTKEERVSWQEQVESFQKFMAMR
ncbi:uncharacterized protein LOC34617839 [Cyclospora cayetanensis]|nr:uncharacterized protein LOC34617839 [Cyclospora cayetanensis]